MIVAKTPALEAIADGASVRAECPGAGVRAPAPHRMVRMRQIQENRCCVSGTESQTKGLCGGQTAGHRSRHCVETCCNSVVDDASAGPPSDGVD